MKIEHSLTAILLFAFVLSASAQKPSKAQATNKTDSVQIVNTLKALLAACKNVDFTDSKAKDSGMFYKAAPYIIYRGADKKRAWKDFANYSNDTEKKGVDGICSRINSSINQDSSYTITKYFTETESEGTWHVLMITYKKKGVDKESAFAFLKVKGRFGLGDID
ncbi:MAG: hypothetical protein WBP16_07085 [Ferruginibacter sp.]